MTSIAPETGFLHRFTGLAKSAASNQLAGNKMKLPT